MAKDPLDVRRKASVEHLISLVQHEVAHAVERQTSLSQVIERPPRRADHDLSAGERVPLRSQRAPSVQQCVPKP
jgi:hypothetical protein